MRTAACLRIAVLAAALGSLPGWAQDEVWPNEALAAFREALSQGRLLGAGSAFERLEKLRALLTGDEWGIERVALLDALAKPATDVYLRYTNGDEIPPSKDDFQLCADHYEAYDKLYPDHTYKGRYLFCKGQVELAARNFDQAAYYLNQSIEADPTGGGYHYNALGVAYLEQGLIKEAEEQFKNAIKKESKGWAYPLHNRALTYIEGGDFRKAQQEYTDAIQQAANPDSRQPSGYLHYNLGLIDYQLGEKKDAQCHYETALKLFLDQKAEKAQSAEQAAGFAKDAALAYNALGVLWKSQGKRKLAEEAYRTSLELNPKLRSAADNLVLLLGRSKSASRSYVHIPLDLPCVKEACACAPVQSKPQPAPASQNPSASR